MLFKQEDLASTPQYNPIEEAANILNDAVYLTEDESYISPKTIPVVENTRIGAGVVQFDDIERLAEENGADYIDAMYAVAEANEIDPSQLAVAVDEWKVIESPEIVNELANVVLKPLSPLDPVALFVESAVDLFVETGDYGYLDCIIFDEADKIKVSMKEIQNGNLDSKINSLRQLDSRRADLAAKKVSALLKLQSEGKGNSPEAQSALKTINTIFDQATTQKKASYNANAEFSQQRKNASTENRKDAITRKELRYNLATQEHPEWKLSGSDSDEQRKEKLKKIAAYAREHRDENERKMAMSVVKDSTLEKVDPSKKKTSTTNGFANDDHTMTNDEYLNMRGGQDPNAQSSDVKETQSFLSKVKHYTIDTPREYIAKAITSLKNKYNSFERVKNANSADPKQKTILQRILSAISTVLSKLENLLTKKKD